MTSLVQNPKMERALQMDAVGPIKEGTSLIAPSRINDQMVDLLRRAAHDGKVKVMRFLVEKFGGPMAPSILSDAILYAAKGRQWIGLMVLLRLPMATHRVGLGLAITFAIRNQDTEMYQFLLQQMEIHTTEFSPIWNCALREATRGNNLELVERILPRCELESTVGECIQIAFQNGFVEIGNRLIHSVLSLDFSSPEGWKMLGAIVPTLATKKPEIREMLLDRCPPEILAQIDLLLLEWSSPRVGKTTAFSGACRHLIPAGWCFVSGCPLANPPTFVRSEITLVRSQPPPIRFTPMHTLNAYSDVEPIPA